MGSPGPSKCKRVHLEVPATDGSSQLLCITCTTVGTYRIAVDSRLQSAHFFSCLTPPVAYKPTHSFFVCFFLIPCLAAYHFNHSRLNAFVHFVMRFYQIKSALIVVSPDCSHPKICKKYVDLFCNGSLCQCQLWCVGLLNLNLCDCKCDV